MISVTTKIVSRERCVIVGIVVYVNIVILLSYYHLSNYHHYYYYKSNIVPTIIIIVIAYVHAGKTCGTARGVRRRWRRCRICVSLCRPADRSCPLSVAGGAVCRGSLTGDGGGGARASARPKGKLARAPNRRGVCSPNRGDGRSRWLWCGGVDVVQHTSTTSLGRPRRVWKTQPPQRPTPTHPTTAGSPMCGFRGTETTKPLYRYIHPFRSSTPDTGCRNWPTVGFPGK